MFGDLVHVAAAMYSLLVVTSAIYAKIEAEYPDEEDRPDFREYLLPPVFIWVFWRNQQQQRSPSPPPPYQPQGTSTAWQNPI